VNDTDYIARKVQRDRRNRARHKAGVKLPKKIVTKHATLTEGDTFDFTATVTDVRILPVRIVKIDGNKITFTEARKTHTLLAEQFVERYRKHIPARTRGTKENTQ
jgi:hypothetical protein